VAILLQQASHGSLICRWTLKSQCCWSRVAVQQESCLLL